MTPFLKLHVILDNYSLPRSRNHDVMYYVILKGKTKKYTSFYQEDRYRVYNRFCHYVNISIPYLDSLTTTAWRTMPWMGMARPPDHALQCVSFPGYAVRRSWSYRAYIAAGRGRRYCGVVVSLFSLMERLLEGISTHADQRKSARFNVNCEIHFLDFFTAIKPSPVHNDWFFFDSRFS